LGLCYMGMGDWAGAVRALEKAVEATSGDRGLLHLLGECRKKADELDQNELTQGKKKNQVILTGMTEEIMVSEVEIKIACAKARKRRFQKCH
ncbi:MAG: hypothetical protein JRG97_08055, partial [Deltaproteobacteria bacterium]|nr:hypothetical protein [Deltaproteobacteria bacterium]